jgi:hypothetical protein
MLPLWSKKLVLGLCGCNRSKTGEADGVKGTILVWPVRIKEDQFSHNTSPLLWGEHECTAFLNPERWSI